MPQEEQQPPSLAPRSTVLWRLVFARPSARAPVRRRMPLRPETAPERPANQAIRELATRWRQKKNRAVPEEPVSFDFQDAPLLTVIETISRLTGRNFDLIPICPPLMSP